MGADHTHGPSRRARLATGALAAAVLAVIGVFTVEPTAHQDDAAQYWTMAGRLARTGDPMYIAAVDHKGPLWVATYRLAWAVSGEQAWFWFLMAMQVVVFAAITAAAVWWTLLSMGASRPIARVSAGLLALYLVFGPEGYSNLLYGRNITTALTALGIAGAWQSVQPSVTRPWRHALLGGVAFGFATQTVFTAAIVFVALTAVLAVQVGRTRWSVLGGWFTGFAAALSSVVLWYAAKGATSDLQTWLWDYNLAYGASDANIAERTWRAGRELGLHLITRPFLLIAPLAIVAARRLPPRWLRPLTFAGAWWFAEVLSVAAPDRWFGHYWILLAAPTACLGGLLVAGGFDARAHVEPVGPTGGWAKAAIGLAAIAALYTIPGIAMGARAAIGFSGVEAHQTAREDRQSPSVAELRAVVARHSGPEDPILVWASAAGPYVAVDRPAATRFDRRTWLTGEVYGSDRLAPVPGTWTAMMQDLGASRPRLIVEYLEVPIAPSSPLGQLVEADYEVVAETDLARVYARPDSTL